MVYILGITCFIHDSSAALIKDNSVVAACEEERFIREKHTHKFPHNAINFCLDKAGISINQVDAIAFYMKPSLGIKKRIPYIIDNFPKSIFFGGKHQRVWWNMVFLRAYLFRYFGFRLYKIFFMEHVLTHAASAYYPSPFSEAAILSIEGCGEWSTTFLGKATDLKIERIKEISYPNSLGFVYGAVTQYLGFRAWNGEGKVMGLAPYGKPVYAKQFEKMIKLEPDGSFSLDLSYFTFQIGKLTWFSERFVDEFGPARKPQSEFNDVHKNLAASLQQRIEQVALHIVEYLYEKTKLPNLCLAGGVALNSSMNGKLLEKSSFKNIFVQPAANDAGCSIGGPLYLAFNNYNMKSKKAWNNCYFGPEFNNETIYDSLKSAGLEPRKSDDVAIETAAYLAKGKLIGWFQGAMEYGPRALGHRSILTDPRNSEMKDILNSKVKFREAFRPFAPSVLEEFAKDYFQLKQISPYMLFISPVKDDKQKLVPAIVHTDGTARPQTINKNQDQLYWKLINEFYKLTGIPVLLNTSFNIRGEPIVNHPKEAIHCFIKTGLDILVIGPYIVEK